MVRVRSSYNEGGRSHAGHIEKVSAEHPGMCGRATCHVGKVRVVTLPYQEGGRWAYR